ncbi:MAG: ERF family protein [Pseudomonadota bacterium]
MDGETENMEMAVAERAAALAERRTVNPIQATLNQIVEKGITTENVAALEKVCDLYERMESLGAKKAYMAAKAALQAELPNVMATKAIPSKDGTIRSRFAPFEEIMAVVQPFMVRHGFSVAFTIRAEDGRMVAVCTLSHIEGHSEQNEFGVRVGSGPPGCSDAQADGAARSYARRGALCDALNIVVDKDTDARMDGASIGAEVARKLQERVLAAGLDMNMFLKLAGADSFANIREGRLGILEKAIAAAVAKGKGPEPTPPAAEVGDALLPIKRAWAKARQAGGRKATKEQLRKEFASWVESVLQGPVDVDDMAEDQIKALDSWFEKHGTNVREQVQ